MRPCKIQAVLTVALKYAQMLNTALKDVDKVKHMTFCSKILNAVIVNEDIIIHNTE